MKRREFITLLGGTPAAWPFAAHAQQPALPAVGYISVSAPSPDGLGPLRKGLGEQGYFEGRNFVFEPRMTDDYLRGQAA